MHKAYIYSGQSHNKSFQNRFGIQSSIVNLTASLRASFIPDLSFELFKGVW